MAGFCMFGTTGFRATPFGLSASHARPLPSQSGDVAQAAIPQGLRPTAYALQRCVATAFRPVSVRSARSTAGTAHRRDRGIAT